MATEGNHSRAHVAKHGEAWPAGEQRDVQWITDGTASGTTGLRTAVPSIYESYATVSLLRDEDLRGDHEAIARRDQAIVALLTRHAAPQPWWLGYLDTGASDTVFPQAEMVTVYWGWRYVVVEAGPEQALSWRPAPATRNWKDTELPELMFPSDRSWLATVMWDDDWVSLGGRAELVADLLDDPLLGERAAAATLDEPTDT